MSSASRASRAARETPAYEGFPPLGADNPAARLLVLGSFPSLRSSEKGEYYGHERNHFWPILFAFAGESAEGRSYAEKRALAEKLGIVIWDTVRVCRRASSADSELEVLELNDLRAFLASHLLILRIGLNGGLAASLFLKALREDELRNSGTAPRRGGRRELVSTGAVATLRIEGRARLAFRLPSTSPVPTSRFKSMRDKLPLWADFLNAAEISE